MRGKNEEVGIPSLKLAAQTTGNTRGDNEKEDFKGVVGHNLSCIPEKWKLNRNLSSGNFTQSLLA